MRLAVVSDVLPALPPSASASPAPPGLRATTEGYALDSYQNLLFSLARFHEYTGRWPTRITVVGYAMKQRRFAELHRRALRWPAERFEYVGIDPDGDANSESARQGEVRFSSLLFSGGARRPMWATVRRMLMRTARAQVQNGYLPYTKDLYGCHGALVAKRRARNVAVRFHPYYSSAPELEELLDWCPGLDEGGQTAVFPGQLPWASE